LQNKTFFENQFSNTKPKSLRHAMGSTKWVDFEAIESLLNAMVLVKLAVETLSRQEATLAIADQTISFLYEKLQGQAGEISALLIKNLKDRITATINETVMNLIRCLNDPNISLLLLQRGLLL
jgi:hypothetical protein